jgi:DNA-binding MarR family transcriptional regulator
MLSVVASRAPEQASEGMGKLVRETFRAMIDCVEPHFDQDELALSQWMTLKLVGSGKITCIGDVTRELGISGGASTRLVDQLERKGLLARTRDRGDRRVVMIALTEQGAATLKAVQPRIGAFWDEQLSIFTAQERQTLFLLLTRLRDSLVRGIPAA